MAAGPNGSFYVLYRSDGLDNSGYTCALQQFATSGNSVSKVGPEQVVNQYTAGLQAPVGPGLFGNGRALAADAAGNYVAVWQSQNQDGSGYGVYASKTFVPAPPRVLATSAGTVLGGSVTVGGTVNPGASPTQVRFEYGTTVSLGQATDWQGVGGGYRDVPVSRALSDLQGNRTYYYRLLATNAVAEEVDGPIQTFTTTPSFQPAEPVGASRTLRVNTPGFQWRLSGRQSWLNNGDTIDVPPGEYLIECRPAKPEQPVPPPQQILIADGTGLETRTISPLLDQRTGSLVVTIEPDDVANNAVPEERGQWRFVGEDDTQWRNGGLATLALGTGAYQIEFRLIDGKVGVASRTVLIQPGQTTQVRIYYKDATASLPGASQPTPVAASNLQTPPYAFSGQFLTDAGSGSGTVVRERVVLTAAHVVFDDVTLTYTTGVQWLFQRSRGTSEPPALTPRGSYVFDAYSRLRTDARDTLGIGEAQQSSQQRDAGAVYFAHEAGRFGYSDVLATGDDAATEWLANLDPGTSQLRNKLLVSYPVDLNFLKAANGYSELDAGRMFATAPAPALFTKVASLSLPADIPDDGLSAISRVYATTALAGYAGGSGGALWVQYDDGNYYPAGIYVGGTDRSVVRAIDSTVVNLISRANNSAQATSDQNNSGGGIVRVESQVSNTSFTISRVRVNFIGLPDLEHAGWHVNGQPTIIDALGAVFLQAGTYTLSFIPVKGFLAPKPYQIQVRNTDDLVIDASYVQLKAPTISTASLPRAVAGRTYATSITAAGAPDTYTVTSDLPAVSGQSNNLQITKRGLLSIQSVPALPGRYSIAVTAGNAQGSMTRTFALEIAATGSLTVRYQNVTDPQNPGDITGSSSTLVMGDKVSLSAVGQKGLLFKEWTGFGIVGLPTTAAVLKFQMASNVELFAEYVSNPFKPRAGTYSSLLSQSPLRYETAGALQLTLAAGGSFTGKLSLPTASYSFGGKFNLDGSYLGHIARHLNTPLQLELAFAPGVSDGVIRGTISGNFLVGGTSVNAALPFTAALPSNPGGSTRNYTVTFPPDPLFPAAPYPQGTSVATLAVSPHGSARAVLLLADGSKASIGSSFTGSGAAMALPLFTPLYTNRGSFFSSLSLNLDTGILTGSSEWYRTPTATQPRFPASWPSGLASNLQGERYLPPNTVAPVFGSNLSYPYPCRFTFGPDGATATNGTISVLGRFHATDSVAKGFNVSIQPATGLITGGFSDNNGFRETVGGVLRQSSQSGTGFTLEENDSTVLQFGIAP